MDDPDIQRIKQMARSLIESEKSEAITEAAELLKQLAEIENQRAQTRKVEDEARDSAKHKKIKDIKEFIALTAPLVTTLVLGGTLVLQSYQFSRTERDKDIDAQRQREAAVQQATQQRDAAEDASWNDAIKQLTISEKWSPAAVFLKRFAHSPRYGAEAQLTAEKLLLLKIAQGEEFKSLFESVFVPIRWERLPQVVEIDSQLQQQINPLLTKVWDDKAQTLHIDRMSPADKKLYDTLNAELDYISSQLAILLKGKRPSSQALTFRSMALWDTDLQGADLSGADITSSTLSYLNLKGANLSAITDFANAVFWGSAWWESSEISPQLCDYLTKQYPLSAHVIYASSHKFTKEEYQEAVARLRMGRR